MNNITAAPLPVSRLKARKHDSANERPAPVHMTDEKVMEEFKVDGLPGVCAFRASMRDTCIRVSTPEMSRRLSKLKGARRVRNGVAGPYLKVWEVPHPMGWVKRYLRKVSIEMNTSPVPTPDNESISMSA